jgi:uncharacterized protein (TIGR02246 family)
MTPTETVLAFMDRINQRDPDKVAELMTEDHVFTDSLGQTVRGREAMRKGWQAITRSARIIGCLTKMFSKAGTSSRFSALPEALLA